VSDARTALARRARDAAPVTLGALALLLAPGCAGDESGPPLRVDERRGTVNGVGVGDRVTAMKQTFGEKAAADPYREPAAPLWVEVGEYEGPSHFGLGPPFYRYEQVSFFAKQERIVGFMVVAPAETASGIATGDELDRVPDFYPRARCGEAPRGDYGHYPACVVRLGPRRFVWFGGDPVSTVMVGLHELGDVAG
jgi:hypothetical protein